MRTQEIIDITNNHLDELRRVAGVARHARRPSLGRFGRLQGLDQSGYCGPKWILLAEHFFE